MARDLHKGGYNSAFLPFFGMSNGRGGIFRFAGFSNFNDFGNLGVYSSFNENLHKQLKTRIRKDKIKNFCVQNDINK